MQVSCIGSLVLLAAYFAGSVRGQCGGSPLVIGPANFSSHLAYPSPNWDPTTSRWHNLVLYPTSVRCEWILRAPAHHVIYAKFLKFDTERDYDFVRIFGSEDDTAELLRVSGDLPRAPWQVMTPANLMRVLFESDDHTAYHGFLLAHHYLPAACVEGGTHVMEDQIIALPPWNLQGLLPGPPTSTPLPPPHPNMAGASMGALPLTAGGVTRGYWVSLASYQPHMNCTWYVVVRPRYVVQLHVLAFDTDPIDQLTVTRFDHTGPRTLLQYGGAGGFPWPLVQSDAPLVVGFTSRGVDQGSMGGSGFLINVTYVNRACTPGPQMLVQPTHLLGYPSHNLVGEMWRTQDPIPYGPDRCVWVVEAPQGYAINVTLLHLDTWDGDVLKAVEEGSTLFELSGTLESSVSFLSSTPRLQLEFSSSHSSQNTGFLLHYNWVLQNCTYTLSPAGGTVRSPYYPLPYGGPLLCSWHLHLPPHHATNILIHEFTLDGGDLLQVKSSGAVLHLLSRAQPPVSRLLQVPPSADLSVVFAADAADNDGVFLLQYMTYREGSCDFSTTPCGYTPHSVHTPWLFDAEGGHMVMTEGDEKGPLLPRGYKAMLRSPTASPSPGGTTKEQLLGAEVFSMCLSVEFSLDGPDAYQLSFIIRPKKSSGTSSATKPRTRRSNPDFLPLALNASLEIDEDNASNSSRYVLDLSDPFYNTRHPKSLARKRISRMTRLKRRAYIERASFPEAPEEGAEGGATVIFVQGPHGTKVIRRAANFTTKGPFEIVVQYERGYGPLYALHVDKIEIHDGFCLQNFDDDRSFNCDFADPTPRPAEEVPSEEEIQKLATGGRPEDNSPRASLSPGTMCGWRNTLVDQHNWVLTDRGMATTDGRRRKSKSVQLDHHADLLSPPLNITRILEAKSWNATDVSNGEQPKVLASSGDFRNFTDAAEDVGNSSNHASGEGNAWKSTILNGNVSEAVFLVENLPVDLHSTSNTEKHSTSEDSTKQKGSYPEVPEEKILCLHFTYEVSYPSADLQLLIKTNDRMNGIRPPLTGSYPYQFTTKLQMFEDSPRISEYSLFSEEDAINEFSSNSDETSIPIGQTTANEILLWSHGRVITPKPLEAFVALPRHLVFDSSQIVFRARSTATNVPDSPISSQQTSQKPFFSPIYIDEEILLQNVDLSLTGTCSHALEDRAANTGVASLIDCSYDRGLCNWKPDYIGGTVWSILRQDDDTGRYHAGVVSSGASPGAADLVSEAIPPGPARELKFRYLLAHTEQCIEIATVTDVGGRMSGGSVNSDTDTTNEGQGDEQEVQEALQVVWQQCRSKGTSWLTECVVLPPATAHMQVIIRSGHSPHPSQVYIADLSLRVPPAGEACAQTRHGGNSSNHPPGTTGFHRNSPGFGADLEDAGQRGTQHPLEGVRQGGAVQWWCEADGTFCGMVQPPFGTMDWVLVDNTAPFTGPSGSSSSRRSRSPSEKKSPRNVFWKAMNQEGELEEGAQFHCPGGPIIPGDWRCDTYSDCPGGEDETRCDSSVSDILAAALASEALASETLASEAEAEEALTEVELSCLNGWPLIEAWICDGTADCPDSSDELHCGAHAPSPALGRLYAEHQCADKGFLCRSDIACPATWCEEAVIARACVGRDALCDGVIHCTAGEDEVFCGGGGLSHDSNPNWAGMIAGNGFAVPRRDVPVIPANPSGSSSPDNFGHPSNPGNFGHPSNPGNFGNHNNPSSPARATFRCNDGLELPLTWHCDGVKDCPDDGLDETGCWHCREGEFVCPLSGLCLPQSAVCDGVLSVPDCTDETHCFTCPPGSYACDVCLHGWQLCDGQKDCANGEDERNCGTLPDLSSQNIPKSASQNAPTLANQKALKLPDENAPMLGNQDIPKPLNQNPSNLANVNLLNVEKQRVSQPVFSQNSNLQALDPNLLVSDSSMQALDPNSQALTIDLPAVDSHSPVLNSNFSNSLLNRKDTQTSNGEAVEKVALSSDAILSFEELHPRKQLSTLHFPSNDSGFGNDNVGNPADASEMSEIPKDRSDYLPHSAVLNDQTGFPGTHQRFDTLAKPSSDGGFSSPESGIIPQSLDSISPNSSPVNLLDGPNRGPLDPNTGTKLSSFEHGNTFSGGTASNNVNFYAQGNSNMDKYGDAVSNRAQFEHANAHENIYDHASLNKKNQASMKVGSYDQVNRNEQFYNQQGNDDDFYNQQGNNNGFYDHPGESNELYRQPSNNEYFYSQGIKSNNIYDLTGNSGNNYDQRNKENQYNEADNNRNQFDQSNKNNRNHYDTTVDNNNHYDHTDTNRNHFESTDNRNQYDRTNNNRHEQKDTQEAFVSLTHACGPHEYACEVTGSCLAGSAVCDRVEDCLLGDDEVECPDDNLQEGTFISLVGGEGSRDPSRLLTPPLRHPANRVALFSFKYRLDGWSRPSNVTLGVEAVEVGGGGAVGVSEWALWRQGGGGGRHWLHEVVGVAPAPFHRTYRLAFVVEGAPDPHTSPQLHITSLVYTIANTTTITQLGLGMRRCEVAGWWCGWAQPKATHGYAWHYARTSPHSRRTGPITGTARSPNSGFIFANSLFGEEGDSADLLSPPLQLPSATPAPSDGSVRGEQEGKEEEKAWEDQEKDEVDEEEEGEEMKEEKEGREGRNDWDKKENERKEEQGGSGNIEEEDEGIEEGLEDNDEGEEGLHLQRTNQTIGDFLPICFRFEFFMFGAHVSLLTVLVRQLAAPPGEGSSEVPLYTTGGSKGVSWLPGGVTVAPHHLGDPNAPFVLVVRATRGPGIEGDIAVDSLSFSPGPCSLPDPFGATDVGSDPPTGARPPIPGREPFSENAEPFPAIKASFSPVNSPITENIAPLSRGNDPNEVLSNKIESVTQISKAREPEKLTKLRASETKFVKEVLLKPLFYSESSRALTAGPAAIALPPPSYVWQVSDSDQDADSSADTCQWLTSCADCVRFRGTPPGPRPHPPTGGDGGVAKNGDGGRNEDGDKTGDGGRNGGGYGGGGGCTWCTTTRTCSHSLNLKAKTCARVDLVYALGHVTPQEASSSCPRVLAPYPRAPQLVDIALPAALSFPVSHVPERLTEQAWTCSIEVRKLEGSTTSLYSAINSLHGAKAPLTATNAPSHNIGVHVVHTLPGYFQGSVVTLAGGARVGVGTVVCKGTLGSTSSTSSSTSVSTSSSTSSSTSPSRSVYLSTLPGKSTTSTDSLPSLLVGAPKLVAADGYVLDSPNQLLLVLYNCTALAHNCTDCTTAPLGAPDHAPRCGWCVETGSCTSASSCSNSMWLQSPSPLDSGTAVPNARCQELDNPPQPPHRPPLVGDLAGHLTGDEEDDDEEEEKDEEEKNLPIRGADHLPQGLRAPDEGSDDLSLVEDDMLSFEGSEDATEAEERDSAHLSPSRRGRKRKPRRRSRRRDEGGDSGGDGDVVNGRRSGGRGRKRSGGRNNVKVAKGKFFLKLPFHPEVYVARDTWRLHTGRQYYVPVTKKMFINLGFVRQAVYGSLGAERSRTVLVDGAWKKATGYYLDLYEKVDQDPVTSIVTSSQSVFDSLLSQLEGDTSH